MSGKTQIYEALQGLGLSAQDARAAVLAFSRAMAPERILVADDFHGLTDKVIAQLKMENECMKFGLDQGNHPDGWYRKFYKPHGKRNLRSR